MARRDYLTDEYVDKTHECSLNQKRGAKMYCPDNYDAFYQHDIEHERMVSKRISKAPECSLCGEKITDEECYELGGELFCSGCIEDNKVYTENYMRE